ncbi:MAG TPA: hypothetical protein DIT67_13020 [Octadecabacter sp.]|nr:hypothetical protein [Octadecabacter sp.]
MENPFAEEPQSAIHASFTLFCGQIQAETVSETGYLQQFSSVSGSAKPLIRRCRAMTKAKPRQLPPAGFHVFRQSI